MHGKGPQVAYFRVGPVFNFYKQKKAKSINRVILQKSKVVLGLNNSGDSVFGTENEQNGS